MVLNSESGVISNRGSNLKKNGENKKGTTTSPVKSSQQNTKYKINNSSVGKSLRKTNSKDTLSIQSDPSTASQLTTAKSSQTVSEENILLEHGKEQQSSSTLLQQSQVYARMSSTEIEEKQRAALEARMVMQQKLLEAYQEQVTNNNGVAPSYPMKYNFKHNQLLQEQHHYLDEQGQLQLLNNNNDPSVIGSYNIYPKHFIQQQYMINKDQQKRLSEVTTTTTTTIPTSMELKGQSDLNVTSNIQDYTSLQESIEDNIQQERNNDENIIEQNFIPQLSSSQHDNISLQSIMLTPSQKQYYAIMQQQALIAEEQRQRQERQQQQLMMYNDQRQQQQSMMYNDQGQQQQSMMYNDQRHQQQSMMYNDQRQQQQSMMYNDQRQQQHQMMYNDQGQQQSMMYNDQEQQQVMHDKEEEQQIQAMITSSPHHTFSRCSHEQTTTQSPAVPLLLPSSDILPPPNINSRPLSPSGEAIAMASAKALVDLGVNTWGELKFPAPPAMPQDRAAITEYARNVEKFLAAQEAVLQEKTYVHKLPIHKQSIFMSRRDELMHILREGDQQFLSQDILKNNLKEEEQSLVSPPRRQGTSSSPLNNSNGNTVYNNANPPGFIKKVLTKLIGGETSNKTGCGRSVLGCWRS